MANWRRENFGETCLLWETSTVHVEEATTAPTPTITVGDKPIDPRAIRHLARPTEDDQGAAGHRLEAEGGTVMRGQKYPALAQLAAIFSVYCKEQQFCYRTGKQHVVQNTQTTGICEPSTSK